MSPALSSHNFRLVANPFPRPDHRPCHPKPPATISCRSLNSTPPESKPGLLFFDIGRKSSDSKAPPFFSLGPRKEPNTVFVAGATGQSGARIVLALLRRGFAVRAGVPNLASAQDLARLAAAYKIISPEQSRRLNAVQSSFGDPTAIARAIGPATKAVVTVGPGENGPDDPVTADGALNVVRAVGLAGVGHLAVVYDSELGAGPSTNNVLEGITTFFSNLFTGAPAPLKMSELLSKIVETDGIGYTFVKTRLTEDYTPERSYPLVLDKEGDSTTTINNSKVSKSQIAKLVADIFSNTSIAENKVFEVSTNASATSKPVAELLSAIPEDGRRKAYAEALAKAKEEDEAAAIRASEKSRKAEAAAKKLKEEEEEVKKLAKQGAQGAILAKKPLENRPDAVASTLDDLFSKAKGLGGDLSWEKLSSQIATTVSPNSSNNEKPQPQIPAIRGRAKAAILQPRKAAVKQQASKPKPAQKQLKQEKDTKTEVRSVFGGLFKQETIYIDDD